MKHAEELNEIIRTSLDGLPLPLVVTRLVVAIVELCEELENHGRDSRVVLRDLMLRDHDDSDGEEH